MTVTFDQHREQHVMRELGFGVTIVGDDLVGAAPVRPEMHVPGTDVLRTSILATWVDTVAGVAAADALAPQVPVTLGLDLHLHRALAGVTAVRTPARVLKTGRSVVVVEVDVRDHHDERLGVGTVSFMAVPPPGFAMPSTRELVDALQGDHPVLAVPFAERARCRRPEPGTAVVPLHPDGLNASMTMNGGLLALAAEEAVLSAAPAGAALTAMSVHHLRPVRVGPAVARAEVVGDVARVEVRDEGADGRVAVVVTARVAPR